MGRLVGAGLGLVAILAVACQRGEGTGEGEGAPGSSIAERAREGYEAQPIPGPETSVGRGIGPGAAYEDELDRAEAAARTPVTEPVEVTGRIARADEDSVVVVTPEGERLELLLPVVQREFRSGGEVEPGPPGELRPGDEVRASYRIAEDGSTVADEIRVTEPAKAK